MFHISCDGIQLVKWKTEHSKFLWSALSNRIKFYFVYLIDYNFDSNNGLNNGIVKTFGRGELECISSPMQHIVSKATGEKDENNIIKMTFRQPQPIKLVLHYTLHLQSKPGSSRAGNSFIETLGLQNLHFMFDSDSRLIRDEILDFRLTDKTRFSEVSVATDQRSYIRFQNLARFAERAAVQSTADLRNISSCVL